MEYKFDNPIHGTIGDIKYQCTVKWRNGQFLADEPIDRRYQFGTRPLHSLLSSVASCTLIAVRMYIDRKRCTFQRFV